MSEAVAGAFAEARNRPAGSFSLRRSPLTWQAVGRRLGLNVSAFTRRRTFEPSALYLPSTRAG